MEDNALNRIRHSSAHIMAQAVRERFSGEGPVRIATGPATATGFYYDFDLPRPLTEADLEWVESRMKDIIREAHPFERRELSEADARSLFSEEPYKIEVIDGILRGQVDDDGLPIEDGEPPALSSYRHDSFEDLCAGPHVANTSQIDPDAVKLLSIAGAYWRGDETRPMLQRIYGTAWESAEDLEKFLWQRAEAERRDHRRIGRELDLFMFDRSAPGMPYWLPDGWRVINRLMAFFREEHEKRGYEEFAGPAINEKSLWEISGHWDHYQDNMFVIPVDEHSTYGVKPMGCPNAMMVFKRRTTSYRELPLRLSDADLLHRHERSGTLQGLMRVQAFRQDDAHIFLPEDQVGEEYERIFEIADLFYGTFGLTYRARLGTRPATGYVGDIEIWDRAEAALHSVMTARSGAGGYEVAEGDGAFYGPKIDLLMQDALGREWQTGTIQLDFNLPRRFKCVYTDANGAEVTPVVIHRAIYGSFERFVGILLEHTAGALPPWLAPRQAAVIPVNGKFEPDAEALAAELAADTGIRATVLHAERGTIPARVREATMAKVPYIIVLGKRDLEAGQLAVRLREGGQLPGLPRAEVLGRIKQAVDARHFSSLEAFADVVPAEAS